MKKLIAWLGVVCCIAAVSAREEIYGLKHDLEKSETLTRTVAALERILDDGTIIRFTADSLFEVTFPDGHKETWNPDKP